MTKYERNMNVLRWMSLYAGVLITSAIFPRPALAVDAHWQVVQYHAYQQVNIDCGAVLLCDIQLQPGEHVRDGLGSLVQLWDNQLVSEGDNPQTPHLVLKPQRAGLHENALITTNRRIYRLYLTSTNSENPTYVRFIFTDEERHERRIREIEQRRIRTTYVRSTATTIEQGCASMPQRRWRADRKPAEFRPRLICQTPDHTFIAFPLGRTQPTDLPVPFVQTADADRPVNYRYDANARVLVIDGTAPNYVLLATSGRRTIRLRILRNDDEHRRR